jgi:hypothetical protein
MKTWSTTVIGTRIFLIGGLRVGHVRNVGARQWYCEAYASGKSNTVTSLADAKAWLEAQF